MKREFTDWPCSLARSVDVFGDSWTLLLVRDAMHGLSRFDEFQRSLHIARNTLSDRLGKLVDAGIMTKRFYQDNPPRYEYLLTEMGRDFFPVLAAMLAWGDKWLDGGAGAPVTLRHHAPGHFRFRPPSLRFPRRSSSSSSFSPIIGAPAPRQHPASPCRRLGGTDRTPGSRRRPG